MTNDQSFKKILGVLVGVIVLIAGAMYFGIHSLVTTNQNIATLTHTIAVDTQQQQSISSTAALVNGDSPDVARVESSIIASDGDVSFIEYLETLARNYNLQVVINSLSLSDDATLTGNGLSTLQVQFEVKGSWSNVYRFTSNIETLPYSFKMNKIDIVNTGDTANLDSTKSTPAPGVWQGLFDMNVLKHI